MKRILMLSPVYPNPFNSGGKVRIKYISQGLAENNKVFFCAPFRENDEISDHITAIPIKQVNYFNYLSGIFAGKPYHYLKWCDPNYRDYINQLLTDNSYDLIFCHFIYTVPYVFSSKTPIVVDAHNIDSIYWRRKLDSFVRKRKVVEIAISYINFIRVMNFERRILEHVKCVVDVSQNDSVHRAKLISSLKNKPESIVAPNGVDVINFPYKNSHIKDPNVLNIGFLGSMNLTLNQDAVIYLISEIAPCLQMLIPNIRINISVIGNNPPLSLTSFSRDTPKLNIGFTGYVPSIPEQLLKLDVLVLPLREGAGTKLRIFEALSCGVPIVGTPLTFDGIDGLIHEKNMLVSDSTEGIVSQIIKIFEVDELRNNIRKNGRYLVERNYDWKAITKKLSDDLQSLKS